MLLEQHNVEAAEEKICLNLCTSLSLDWSGQVMR